jgi:diaminopropionate ammonia-lyase
MTILLPNPGVDPGFVAPAPVPDADGAGSPLAFHRRLPGYEPTALVAFPALAEAAGVGEVWVKDESSRFGLPAFKMLGASWASYLALVDALAGARADQGADASAERHLGPPGEWRPGEWRPWEWRSVDELAAAVAALRPLTLVTATDGNHGRAVARFARWLGLDAHVFVPDGTARARIEAIEGEGARVDVVDGDYDAAVRAAAALAGPRALVISDTAWPGYERVPGWVIDGYSTIFAELEEQLAARAIGAPDAVLVQVGVGAPAFLAAVLGTAAEPKEAVMSDFEIWTLYTTVAGLLNVLVVMDAVMTSLRMRKGLA